jgi:UTP--glucose-1-phosphate uridylyltransferase
MLPVGRKPVVQYVVEELASIGINRVLFITGPSKTSIESHFDLNDDLVRVLRESGKEELLAELAYERMPVEYFYTRQRRLLGLGHAILCSKPFVGREPFVVALGDSLIGTNSQSDIVKRMVHCFANRHAAAVIAFEKVPLSDVRYYGIAQPKKGGDVFEVEDLVEKPSESDAPSNLAVAARYVFSPDIFTAIQNTGPGKGNEIQITDAIRFIIKGGGKVYGVRLLDRERRYDIGNFQSYFRAFVDCALADEKQGPQFRQYLASRLFRKTNR